LVLVSAQDKELHSLRKTMKSRDGQAHKLSVYSKRLKILITIAYFAIASFGSLVHAETIQLKKVFEKDCLKSCLLTSKLLTSKLSNPSLSSLCRSSCQCMSSKILSKYNVQQLEQMSSDQITLTSSEIESCIKPHLN